MMKKVQGVENGVVEARTIFVRNLPYSFSEDQLQEVFSEIGPVRRSFIIKEKGSDQHRGFGYVHFAVAEDALRAVKGKDGTVLDGRKIMVKVAKQRPSFEARRMKKLNGEPDSLAQYTSEPTKKTVTQKEKESLQLNLKSIAQEKLEEEKASERQRVARTVILGGLVSLEMRESAIEYARKVGPVESIQSSLSPQELKGRGLEKDGCKGGAAVVVFKSVKTAARAVAELHRKPIGNGSVWARQLGGEGAKTRKWRIIIRNLPYTVTEETIQELFASSGFVWEVNLPRKENGQARGFAFASFISKASAEKAIHDLNGKRMHQRLIAVDWAVERRTYLANTNMNLGHEEEMKSDLEVDETASESEEDMRQESSFFKDLEDKQTETEMLVSCEEVDLAKRVLNKVVSMSSITKPENDELEECYKDNDNGCASHSKLKMSQSESKTVQDQDHGTQIASQGDLERTIFIKNLPFDVKEATLQSLFSAFGMVESTYLVRHPKTKRPKGTAFLHFMNRESAEAAIAAASGSNTNKDFVGGILHGGRKLEVLQALKKTSVASLEKEKLEQRSVDRRNLYLLSEGKIEDGSPAAVGVSEQDMQKRRQLVQVKKAKLKSPKFHVSKTRLAVHNVPKSLNESALRMLFIEAVKLRATKQEPVIKQVKIVKDKDKGKRSRGFAFVEFTKHDHALVALRVLNNNPETFTPERRPIVEFAIENVQLIRQRLEQLSGRDKGADGDSKGNFPTKKPEKDEIKYLRMEKEVPAKKLGGTDTSMEKLAIAKRKRKTNLHEVPNPRLKRQRENSGLQGVEDDSTPSVKLRKLSNGNVKRRRDVQDHKDKPLFDRSKVRSLHSNGSKQKMSKGDSVSKDIEPNLASQRLPKKPKLLKNKRRAKPEVEDKLDKLVAAYREKYFNDRGQKKNSVKQ